MGREPWLSRHRDRPREGQQAHHWLEFVADPIRLHILRHLSAVDASTIPDINASRQISAQTLRRHLEALVHVGVIREHRGESDGETPGRPPTRFSLDPRVRESFRTVAAVLPQLGSQPPAAP